MSGMCGAVRPGAWVGAGVLWGMFVSLAAAQDFPTGIAEQAWNKWRVAMEAYLEGKADDAEAAFGELLELDPSPLRLALMGERSVRRAGLGGPLLLLEQDYAAGDLDGNTLTVAERLIEVGREQLAEADDGWHFASIGRFDVANANFQALLASGPDPVALLEFADQKKQRHDVLIQIFDSPIVGEAARGIARVLARGEILIKADPIRIKENIGRLGGPPRAFENAVARLKDSGEYSVPFLVQFLRNPETRGLTRAMLRTLPQIDRPALNPLVMALDMDDHATKRALIHALGQIGYGQAVPYLLKLRENPATPAEVRASVDEALGMLSSRGVGAGAGENAAAAFYRLAEAYYNGQRSLAADPRLEFANAWYWRDGLLQNVEVPTEIFDEVMCMRSCWQALQLDRGHKPALALWLAANFRREAQLPAGASDRTLPDGFPSGAYFAQAAGAEYCLLALSRAIADGDPAVALGAIEALRKTGGAASVVGDDAGRQPLAEALTFSDRMVRIRAALALGRSLPTQRFSNYQNLMPVLIEALNLHGGSRNALVVDPDETSANTIAAGLRAAGFRVVTDAELGAGLAKARAELSGVDAIVLASDVKDAPLAQAVASLRSDVVYRALPVVLVSKPGDRAAVRELVRGDHRLAIVLPGADPAEIRAAIDKVARAVGAQTITSETGLSLALEAAQTMGMIALTQNPVFNVADAEGALAAALASSDVGLRITVAEVLGYLGLATAQQQVALVALDAGEDEIMRVAMFEALAAAAKRRGNLLPDDTVQRIVAVVASKEESMPIREAASQALGALNLPGVPAGDLIRNQFAG